MTTSHSYSVLLKLKFPSVNLNVVFPVGTFAPFLYLETKPKLAFPSAPPQTVQLLAED